MLFGFDLELSSGVVDVGHGCELGDEFRVVWDADLAICESLSQTVEHLGSEVEELLGFFRFVSAVHSDCLDAGDLFGISEFLYAVYDGGAESDFVDVDGFDVVLSCDFEGFAGGVHEVGLAV